MKCCGPRVPQCGAPPPTPGSRAPKDEGYIHNKKQWKKILYTENTYLGGRLGATIFSITTLSITTFSIKTLTAKGLFGTLSIMTFGINDTQHNSTLHYAECHILFIVMLSVVMMSVVVLNVVMLNIVMLSVVALNAQYRWPPWTNQFRPAVFYIKNIIYLCAKTSYLNEEVNRTEPSLSASFPCFIS